MTTIDPSQRLAVQVRNEVAALRERTAARAQPGGGSVAARGDRAAALHGALAQRIAAIARDDPQRKQKAFRVFLETALLQELGAGLIHDAGFPQLVEAVQFRMQGDAQLAGAAEDLATYLLQAPAGKPPA